MSELPPMRVPDDLKVEPLDVKHGTGIVTATKKVVGGGFKGLTYVIASPFRKGTDHDSGDAMADVIKQANEE